jgi:hypothetical protein
MSAEVIANVIGVPPGAEGGQVVVLADSLSRR